ncbi:class I SAM-dependent methyltransferase [Rhizobium glycinendophyticum]|uniref:Class I SAM-dependent methyltransferase n=1 Tax=Rhizobium glycinendophyticum TaxID=2589807 RepID=A0A504U591_9HYPH|nr:class I SAM-dependent methyltransferase [Rhizobium glycinendophyticum]TPP09609.1 class I SAM-dependent methyltransferase [Rhizobium glycinendophyticum]
MTRDPSLAFYEENAALYAARDRHLPERQLNRFVERLAAGARILELGCGAGGDSAELLQLGFDVTPSDGSASMASQAERRLGRPVLVLPFQELAYEAEFDGIWANACLLHVPRADLADVLARIAKALRPHGRLYASFKTGGAEGTDRFGRYYNRPTREELAKLCEAAGFVGIEIETLSGGAFDGEPTTWLYLHTGLA